MKVKGFLLCLLCVFLVGKAQAQNSPKNSISVSIGAWERDYSVASGYVDHAWGPMGAIEYQRVLNDYFSFRGKFFGGGIYRSDHQGLQRHYGFSAGIMLTPLGAKFKYLKIGVAPAFLYEGQTFTGAYGRDYTRSDCYFGLEFPIRFHIIDNDKRYISIGWDIVTAFQHSGYGLFTAHSLLTYGLKF